MLVRNMVIKITSRDDVKLVAVCLQEKQKHLPNIRIYWLRTLSTRLRQIVGRNKSSPIKTTRPISLKKLSRHHNFEILIPPEGDINNPKFVKYLKETMQPTTAISLYCLQKFSKPLIDVFNDCVNYHNGLLPQYRGLKATAWSLYNNESETGFVFHRMTENIDEGPVLIQKSFKVDPEKNSNEIEIQKALISVDYIDPLIEKISERDPGRAQQGQSKYYSRSKLVTITKIEDPQHYSSSELKRRLRAFLALNISLQGRQFRVTRIQQIEPGQRRRSPTFQSSDGKTFTVTRIEYLPYTLFVLRKIALKTYAHLKKIVSMKYR